MKIIIKSISMLLLAVMMVSFLPLINCWSDLGLGVEAAETATEYALFPFSVFELEEYCDFVIDCLEILPPNLVIHRLTGDGPKALLIAPLWTGNKRMVLNRIQKYLKDADIWQGKEISCQNHLHSIN